MNRSYSRICLAGEDLDWTDGSSILCNINLTTEITIKGIEPESNVIEIYSSLLNQSQKISRNEIIYYKYNGDSFDYIIAAIKIFKKHYFSINNIQINIISNIPVKSGLSSSAALLTCFFKELFSYYKINYDINLICDLCYQTEYHELNSQVGKMDFYSCISNGIIYYESKTNTFKKEEYKFRNIETVLISCGLTSSTKEINSRKLLRYQSQEFNFMQYIKYGNSLVEELINEIRNGGNIVKIGAIINRYQNIIDKYLNVSTAHIGNIVKLCTDSGAYGAKLTGCGLGGYVFALIERSKCSHLMQILAQNGLNYIITEPI